MLPCCGQDHVHWFETISVNKYLVIIFRQITVTLFYAELVESGRSHSQRRAQSTFDSSLVSTVDGLHQADFLSESNATRNIVGPGAAGSNASYSDGITGCQSSGEGLVRRDSTKWFRTTLSIGCSIGSHQIFVD
jgi:hypothetical protein